MSVEITEYGFKDANDILKEIKDNLNDNIQKSLHLLGEMIVSEARSNLQNNTNIDSGSLLSSIIILDEQKNMIIVGTNTEYAWYIEYGRGPIRPKDPDGWLHWIDKQTGKDVFAKFAKATEPSPFMEPAVINVTGRIDDIFFEQL